jgi:hypothetical protein
MHNEQDYKNQFLDVKKSKKSSEVANTRRKPQEFQVVHVLEAIKEESELNSKFLQGVVVLALGCLEY